MAKKLPEVLTEQEREVLLSVPNKRYPSGFRNYIMLNIMLNAGLRLSEVTALRWKDIDLISGRLTVRSGKGAKDRVLWLNEDDVKLLQEWKQKQAGLTGEKPEYVFTGVSKGKTKNPVNNTYLYDFIKKAAEKAGIEKNISPHTLRHSFATDLLTETKNLRWVQAALGHSSLVTTQIYAHICNGELENALKNFRKKEKRESVEKNREKVEGL